MGDNRPGEAGIGRRHFLGGTAALVGAVALGGCRESADEPAVVASTGGGPNAGDLDLAAALGQIEQSLADAFDALLEARTAELPAAGLAERVAMHRDRHAEHAQLLAEVLEGAGADPALVHAAFPGMQAPDERDLADLPLDALVVRLLRCEAAAAATAVDAVGRISVAELRGLVASVGAADAGLRQSMALAMGGLAALDQSDVADGLLPLTGSYLTG